MKKVLALVMAAALALSLVACGGSDSSSSTPASQAASSAAGSIASTVPAGGKVGICIYKFDDNFMTVYRNKLEEILTGKGYEVSVVDGNNDQAKQTEQISTFITQGVDALIINPVMTSAAEQIVSMVKDANIPTVLINREPTEGEMAVYVRE